MTQSPQTNPAEQTQPSSKLKEFFALTPTAGALLLMLVTLAVYARVAGHPFVQYDDAVYVTGNNHIRNGLTADAFSYAFTSRENWHPLTWLSHALDCQLFGLDAKFHHVENVLLHVL